MQLAPKEPYKPSLFLTPRSLGGKLTLVNANFWLIFLLLARGNWTLRGMPDYLGYPLPGILLFMSLPIGCWAPMLAAPINTPGEIALCVVLLGANTFVWGFGLAWVLSRVGKSIRK